MIAYEIQLRYVIRDKIQSQTKFQSQTKSSPRQNSVREKNPRKIFFVGKKIVRKKTCLGRCLGLAVRKVSCLIDAHHH